MPLKQALRICETQCLGFTMMICIDVLSCTPTVSELRIQDSSWMLVIITKDLCQIFGCRATELPSMVDTSLSFKVEGLVWQQYEVLWDRRVRIIKLIFFVIALKYKFLPKKKKDMCVRRIM